MAVPNKKCEASPTTLRSPLRERERGLTGSSLARGHRKSSRVRQRAFHSSFSMGLSLGDGSFIASMAVFKLHRLV